MMTLRVMLWVDWRFFAKSSPLAAVTGWACEHGETVQLEELTHWYRSR